MIDSPKDQSAYEKFKSDPKVFVLSTLLFVLQIVLLGPCIVWVLALLLAVLGDK